MQCSNFYDTLATANMHVCIQVAETVFLFFSAGWCRAQEMPLELQVGDVCMLSHSHPHPQHLMTVIICVAITTLGCSMTCTVVSPHMHSRACTPEIRTGSSSLTVFMELTSICLCSWCVSSCCLSSIIFDILVMPENRKKYVENVK